MLQYVVDGFSEWWSGTNTVAQKVVEMVTDPTAKHLAGKYGLDIMNVAWEDNGRWKNSCWGPCISDMTLQVGNYKTPLIRSPNFSDLTWDVPMEKIPLVIGNERGGGLSTVTLKEYLQNFSSYQHPSATWATATPSLLAPTRDSHVIMSSQACFLPVAGGSESTFNVAIFNYQSSASNPAVLAIVSTINDGVIMVSCQSVMVFTFTETSAVAQNLKMCCSVQCEVASTKKRSTRGGSNVEDAIVKVCKSEGRFSNPSLCGPIERDPRFPVRVTLQYYKCTDNGVINENDVNTIAKQISNSRKNADFVGSLVVGGNTGRPTEHNVHQPQLYIPMWWDAFWLTYKNVVPVGLTVDVIDVMSVDQRSSDVN